jgi:monothiol glutaredoxin
MSGAPQQPPRARPRVRAWTSISASRNNSSRTPQCGFSAAAVRTLEACGASFGYVNIFEDPELREALKRYSNWPTYPQLYVNGELVGGSDILTEMFQKGELQQLLEEAGAVKKA